MHSPVDTSLTCFFCGLSNSDVFYVLLFRGMSSLRNFQVKGLSPSRLLYRLLVILFNNALRPSFHCSYVSALAAFRGGAHLPTHTLKSAQHVTPSAQICERRGCGAEGASTWYVSEQRGWHVNPKFWRWTLRTAS